MLKNNQVINLDSEHFQNNILPSLSQDQLKDNEDPDMAEKKKNSQPYLFSTRSQSEKLPEKTEPKKNSKKVDFKLINNLLKAFETKVI